MKSLPLALIYICEKSVIVAPTHAAGDGGPYYEQENHILLTDCSSAELGAAIKESLKLFSIRERDLRKFKKTDWPAYRASRCTSVKRFEEDFQRIRISYLNPSGAGARAEIEFEDDPNTGIFTLFNPHFPNEIVGKQIENLMNRFSLGGTAATACARRG
jgi:hypothetical protein